MKKTLRTIVLVSVVVFALLLPIATFAVGVHQWRVAACRQDQKLSDRDAELVGWGATRLGAEPERRQFEIDLWRAEHPRPEC